MNLINTQVISINAKNSNNQNLAYPTGSPSSYQCFIPFAYAPWTCPGGNYSTFCLVASQVSNGSFASNSLCSIQPTSSVNGTVVNCSTFGTIGVTCNSYCKLNVTAFANANIKGVNNKTSTHSNFANFRAFIFILFLALFI